MNQASNAIRRSSIDSNIEHLILDMPGKSANVMTQDFLAELSATIDQLESINGISGVIFSSAKPAVYIAGADIVAISNTLNWKPQQVIEFCRHGQSVLERLSHLPCPVVAAIHGVCVGGGLEFALACDARVATADRKTLLGLPEVRLGLIPGWAGTVRLPRLIELQTALELVTTGQLISGEKSFEVGLVDAVTEPDALLDTAVDMIRKLAAGGGGALQSFRSARRHPIRIDKSATNLGDEMMQAIESNRDLHPQAPTIVLEHILDSAADPFEKACEKEALAMSRVYGTDPCAGLINAFFLSERAKKSGRFPEVVAAEIDAVAIVGAGVMGGDIAQICPIQKPIGIYDVDGSRADAVADLCNSRPLGTGSARVAREIHDLRQCDLVIESIVEDVAAKQQILCDVEKELSPNAILTSNTSVIRIGELAERLQRPERFCGLHFCYPSKIRRLVEVVRGPKTSTETLATVCEWVRSLGKVPLPVADSPGFIINRLLCPMFNEVGHLLTQGCGLLEIESAVRDFGFALGPCEFMDAIGLDTLNSAGTYLIPRLTTRTEPSLLLHAMNKAGWKGRKSGRGFYSYTSPESSPKPNDQLDGLIGQYLHRSPQPLESDEIVRRLLMVMVNQAADVVAERVVADPDEIDLAFLLGAGFPSHRGGLLFWAFRQGLSHLVDEMSVWASARNSNHRYRVSPALRKLAAG